MDIKIKISPSSSGLKMQDIYDENACPKRFYRVDKSNMKSSPNTAIGFSLFIYIVVVGAFIAVLYSQSLVTYTTTKTTTSDETGQNGYSCAMATIYNSVPVQIDQSVSDPAIYYQLINVNELKSDCQLTMNDLSPCSQPMLYTPGQSSAINKYIITTTAYGNGNLSIITQNTPGSVGYSLYTYDTIDGSMELAATDVTHSIFPTGFPAPQFYSSIVGKQYDNYTFYIDGVYLRSTGYKLTYTIKIGSFTVGTVLMVTNDNFYNLYIVAEYSDSKTYVFKISGNVKTGFATGVFASTTPVTLATSGYGISFAVYNSSIANQLNIFFTSAGNVYKLGSTMTIIYPAQNAVNYATVQFSTDGSELYANSYDPTVPPKSTTSQLWKLNIAENTTTQLVIANNANCFLQRMSTATYAVGFGVLEGNNILGSCYLPEYQDTYGGMVLYNTSAQTYTSIQYGYLGSSAGWFTCADQLKTKFPNNLLTGGNFNCSLNGIIWRSTYSSARYLTPSAMESAAKIKATSLCTATTYNQICNRIGNIPPYICTKEQGQPYLTTLSTALANASLLYTVLVTIVGIGLSVVSNG